MVKKVIAFDLDGTLVPSKSAMLPRMGAAISALLHYRDVCIISGGKFAQFQKQLLSNIDDKSADFSRLHLLPTCGTQYFRFDTNVREWTCVYAELLTESERQCIANALAEGFHALGYEERHTYGPPIDDRGGLITYSALGQDVVDALGDDGVLLKEGWDPSGEKKRQLRDYIAALIPEFEVRVGSATSIDVTRPGVDKAYGMQKLLDALGVSKEQVVYFGDRLSMTGNDYPIKAMGIEAIQVSSWEDTAQAVENMLGDLTREARS